MQRLYERLYETYQKLPDKQRASVFTCMVGNDYFKRDVRFMLVGRAANGWDDLYDTSSSESFGENAKTYFDNHKRWEWIQKNINGKLYTGKDDNGKYFSHSRFWSYTEEIYKGLADDKGDTSRIWMENIAWSNLYKISPKKGNPSSRSLRLQWDGACPDILDREIELLKPTHIVFETDYDWLFDRIKKEMKEISGEYIRANGIYMGASTVIMSRPERAKKDVYVRECITAK